VHAQGEEAIVAWPRVRADCSFSSPLRFEDEFEVHLRVARKAEKSVTYEFRLIHEGRVTATGSITAVCATLDPATGRMKSIPIPEAISRKIEAADAVASGNGKD
jgi:acyl-CoA thioesterase FadM